MAVDDNFTVSLLHFDGADTSTTFTDESGKSWTKNGDAQIDTAQSKFGGASGLFDGTGDYITTADSADWYVAAGDFTVDLWFRRAGGDGSRRFVFGQANAALDATSRCVEMFLESDNKLYGILFYGGASNKSCGSNSTITDTNWHHAAFVRNGNALTLYLDGVAQTDVEDTTGITSNNSGEAMSIGRDGSYNGSYWNGHIDEFRFSKGVARFTANFTPPNIPYGQGGQVIIWTSE